MMVASVTETFFSDQKSLGTCPPLISVCFSPSSLRSHQRYAAPLSACAPPPHTHAHIVAAFTTDSLLDRVRSTSGPHLMSGQR